MRNIILAISLGIFIFFINKVVALVIAILFFIYLNASHNKREHHEDMAIFYQEGGGK